MTSRFDAIIIGAGPAGSSAAILLASAGWQVALVEKHIFPRRKVCGECIAASNLPLFDAIGVGAAVRELAGPPLRRVGVMVADKILRAPLPPYDDPAHPWGVALSREYLDTLLLAQAAQCGAAVYQPWLVRQIDGGPGDYACRLRKSQDTEEATLTADVLIDAHGSWEVAPTSPDLQHGQHRPSDLFAFKANFVGTGLEKGWLPVLSFPGGYGGMVIADRDTATLAFCMRRDALAQARARRPDCKAAEAAAAFVAQACEGVGTVIHNDRQQGAWLSSGPLRPGIRLSRQSGGAFLIGNAAGEAHPIIGEGISMAVQSAWLLAHLIAPYRQQLSDALLYARLRQEYATAWHRHFARRIRLAAVFAHLAMRPALMRGCAPALEQYPSLLTRLAQWSGKVQPAPSRPRH